MSAKNNEGTENTVDKPIKNNIVISQNPSNMEVVKHKTTEKAQKVRQKSDIPFVDYDSMNLEKLNEKFQKLLKNYEVYQVKDHIETIKRVFDNKFKDLLAQKKATFLEEGGNIIDFYFSNPTKLVYNKLLLEYKNRKQAYYNQLEKQLKENLSKRNLVITELKALIEKADAKTMYADFKALEVRWKAIGSVPRTKNNDTWRVYHHHVERFYDLLQLNNNFKALDFKHNLNKKLTLIDSVKALDQMENINEAFKELQHLHRIWKEEIGPVAREHRESIWQEFSEATKKIHDKRHHYIKDLNANYKEIIKEKSTIITQINTFDTSQNKTRSDWQKSINQIETLREAFFSVGKLPHAKSKAVWEQFKEATKNFNRKKNEFYKTQKSVQQENLKKKRTLIELARSFKDSQDWKTATSAMKKAQADWKKIGQVPAKFSDEIWREFKTTCNAYFERFHNSKNELTQQQQAIIETKKVFLEQLKEKENHTLESIQQAVLQWNTLGNLPSNMNRITSEFNKILDRKLTDISLGKDEIELLKFKNLVADYLGQEQYEKLDSEKVFIKRKMEEITRESQQLENNLSFISSNSKDNILVKNAHTKVTKFKEAFAIWKLKLDYLKKLKY